MKLYLLSLAAVALLIPACGNTPVTPVTEEVVLSFAGTVQTVSYGGAAEVPPDVQEGAPVVARISYLLNSAELAVDESTRHMYVFPNAEEAVVRFTVGATSWAVHMKFLWTCDGCAEGLADGISGGGEPTESRNFEFPGLVDGRGIMHLSFDDTTAPYDLLSSVWIPQSARDLNSGTDGSGGGGLWTGSERGFWNFTFSLDRVNP